MRRSGVRIPLAPPQADIRSGCRFFVCSGALVRCRVVVLLVAPLVFRALRCDALWGPAAVCAGGRRPAREIATREPAARSGRSRGPPWPCRHPPAPRPGPATAHGHRSQALPPPTGTEAVPSGPSGAAPRSPPVPSGPSGALHTCGAGSLFGSSTRRLVVRPGLATARWHRSQAPQALHPALAHIAAGRTRNVACNSPATCSSHEIITLELQRFQTLLKLHPIELHAFFGGKNLPPPSALRLGSRSLRCPPY